MLDSDNVLYYRGEHITNPLPIVPENFNDVTAPEEEPDIVGNIHAMDPVQLKTAEQNSDYSYAANGMSGTGRVSQENGIPSPANQPSTGYLSMDEANEVSVRSCNDVTSPPDLQRSTDGPQEDYFKETYAENPNGLPSNPVKPKLDLKRSNPGPQEDYFKDASLYPSQDSSGEGGAAAVGKGAKDLGATGAQEAAAPSLPASEVEPYVVQVGNTFVAKDALKN